MRDHPDTGKTFGNLDCQACGADVKLKCSTRGLPYYNCDSKEGGCGSQFFARTADAQKHIASKVKKWIDPAERKRLLGDDALPKKARVPADDPAADDAPGDEAPGDDAPNDPPAAVDPPQPQPLPNRKKVSKRVPPQPPKARPVKLFGRWS
jgi:hypothetical protein